MTKEIPKGKELEQLKWIKKRRKEQMLEDNGGIDVNSEDYKLAKLIESRANKGDGEERIKEIITKIKKLQKKQNISEFNRGFLNKLLKSYCNLAERTRERRIQQIINHSKFVGDKLISSKRFHYSGCFLSKIEPTQYFMPFYTFL